MFKKSLLAMSIAAAATLSANVMANQESAGGEKYIEEVESFISGATLTFAGITDTRYRQHKIGVDADMKENLNYTDYNIVADFQSGMYKDTLGLNIAGYFSGSPYNNGACSEISQCTNWDQNDDRNGTFKLNTAAIKLQAGSLSGQVGLIQGGVGTIGNVWSFVPGTYRGAKAFWAINDAWTLSYMFADQHTAPWQLKEEDNHTLGKNAFDFTQSLGLTGNINGVSVAAGIGHVNLSRTYVQDWLPLLLGNKVTSDDDSISVNLSANYGFSNGMAVGFQMYGVNSVEYAESNSAGNIDDTDFGAHYGLTFSMPVANWTWESQLQYTTTGNGIEFTPRGTYGYGSQNGNWGLWWDAISDWNQDKQIAWSNRASTSFGDGWFAYLGAIVANGTDDGKEQSRKLDQWDNEWAINGTIGYSVPRGALKGTTARFHVTHLERDMKQGSYDYQKDDFRFQIIVPYNFL